MSLKAHPGASVHLPAWPSQKVLLLPVPALCRHPMQHQDHTQAGLSLSPVTVSPHHYVLARGCLLSLLHCAMEEHPSSTCPTKVSQGHLEPSCPHQALETGIARGSGHAQRLAKHSRRQCACCSSSAKPGSQSTVTTGGSTRDAASISKGTEVGDAGEEEPH